ncbi:SdiA-regulated domain-containing protein [Luteolibacter yonseiensis]|uniref:SdiA-regulated domain-containing protein n=1 Tax=Luteolibacter yonseiensis TaxID=1144680 RepID=A0A934R692_9BACT|nr:SdiA-regulated domain-containing protein [Luteolibacter yonseiensis]MBK1816195.1 SdiA-regulated domain-containing protein [Luteolibacter yonseiensis]
MKFTILAASACAATFSLLPARGDVLVRFDNGSVDQGGFNEVNSPGTYNLPFEAVDWSDHVQSPSGLQVKGQVKRVDTGSSAISNWGTALRPSDHISFKVSALPGHKLNLTSFSFNTALGEYSYNLATSFVWAYRVDGNNDGTFEQDWTYGTLYSQATHGAAVFDRARTLDWALPGLSTTGTIEFGLFATAPNAYGTVFLFSTDGAGNGGLSLNGTVTKSDGSAPAPLPPLPPGILDRYTHTTNYYLSDGEAAGYPYDQIKGKVGAPEASGVTYNRDTDTLFMVGDEGYAMAQFTKQGQFVNSMLFDYKVSPRDNRALDDPEGITYLGNNTFGVADERDNMLRITTFDPAAMRTLTNLTPTSYPFGPLANNNDLEGVAYDPINKSIWGLKEQALCRVYEMSGVPGVSEAGTKFSVAQPIARKWLTRAGLAETHGSSLATVSDIFVLAASKYLPPGHPSYRNLLLLGRDAEKIVEITREGRLVSTLDISMIGRQTIEGITMDDDGVIYLVSEGNLKTGAPPELKNSGLHVFTPAASPNYTLQLLHLSDGEAGLLASQTAPNLAALVDAFDDDYENTLILSGGDNFIPSPFLNAGTDPSLNAVPGIGATAFARPDIAIHNALGVEASAIGNHEWDLGSNVFADAFRATGAWVGAQFPHISLNLDFSGDAAINPHFNNVALDGATTGIPEASGHKGKIVPTAVITKGGEKIGLVGVTTQLIESISSPSGTKVKGAPGGDNMDLLASQIQPYINELAAEGVNKIILLAHLQQITNEQALITKLSGVDIVLSAGSNTRLGDSDDVAAPFPGHAATFAGDYPIRTAGLDGKPALIVNTDNEFTYLGRLVVDFDENGELVLGSLDDRKAVNGAKAATAENAAAAWGTTVGNLAATAFAPGTKGAKVKAITDAVQAVISAKDGEVFGYTSVYLEGERAFVRSEETNLGDITADANAGKLRAITGSTAPIVSLKNGGGIRAQIGAVSSAGGSAVKLPPPANPAVGKLEGGVSRLDIENALRFDNKLIAFDTTAAGLKAILEHGVAQWPNQGRFPQLGGVSFAWDPARTAGDRIRTISLIGDEGELAAALYKDGALVAGTPENITVVTLNFIANNGDGYPVKANGSNFRYLLANNTLGPALDEANDFTVPPSLPGNPIGEQQVFGDYLASRHATPATAYSTADTPATSDLRIQKLDVRSDVVLPYSLAELVNFNRYSDALRLLGLDPLLAITSPQALAALQGVRNDGRDEVLANPGGHGLYTEDSIQDLRGTGVLVRVRGGEVHLSLPLERSTTLGAGSWAPVGALETTLPQQGNKEFYRLTLPK